MWGCCFDEGSGSFLKMMFGQLHNNSPVIPLRFESGMYQRYRNVEIAWTQVLLMMQ